MKRFLSFLLALNVAIAVLADAKGHYWLDVEDQNIPVESATDYFSEWFNLGEGVTFTIFNDETDNIGMRHIAYQQYISGVKAEHQMILVHAREGRIVSVNTSIIEAENQPKSIRPRLSKKQAKDKLPSSIGDAELLIITCTIDDIETARLAYKTIDFVNHEDVYIDAETGEVIKRISHIHSADVQGQGYTMYNDWQNMTVNETSGYYMLVDEARKIMTMNATNSRIDYIYKWFSDANNGLIAEQDVFATGQQAFLNFFNTCTLYLYETANCQGTAITSITITYTPNNDWWYSSIDTQLDLFVKIYDCNDKLMYTSDYYSDCVLPQTIQIPNVILQCDGYKIEIWDYDPVGNDFGSTITLNTTSKGSYNFSNSKVTGSITISSSSSPELDAYWGMQQTYDFYKNVFGHESYDNKGAEIIQLINPPQDTSWFKALPNNAIAKPMGAKVDNMMPDIMAFGLGDGVTMKPFVSLDMVAHEFTHLVTAYSKCPLGNQGETGALNESFSDIMAFSVENYILGDTDYLIGEEIIIGETNVRSMKDPNNSGQIQQPDTYKGEYWASTSNPNEDNDQGGVHYNNGVQNKWFYLLSEGGSGVNDNNDSYSVKGIGIQKAQKIAYYNLMYYLTSNATFTDARNGAIQAAVEIYDKGSQECISTANAWHAVGVGNAFEDMGETPTELAAGDYVVVAQRKDNTNYFYMTSTPNNGRYTAVDTKTSTLNAVETKDLGSEYVWTVIKNGEIIQLKNGSQFSTWNGGNKAILGNTGKDLTVTTNEDGSFTLTFAESETVTRYLSLNADTKYDYFAYYGNTNQIEQLHFLPYTASATTNVEQLTVSNIHAYSIDNTIIIEAVDAMPVMVFNATGQCIFNEVVSSARVPATHGGMYLVKTPTEVVKVIVR